jgi:hypothetical protein
MALWKLYLEDPHHGSLGYAGYHDWTLLEGRYTPAVLFEYAGTGGLIDLDYLHPTGAATTSATTAAATCLTRSADTTAFRRSGSTRWAATPWA